MMDKYDLILIGGGSAAFSAAIRANKLQLNTLLVNDGLPLGGTCVNVGCVPSKFLIRAAEHVHRASHSPFQGVSPKGVDINFQQIIRQKKQLVAGMQKEKYVRLLNDLEFVTVVEGFAKFENRDTIVVDGSGYQSQNIIIASGSTTAIPPIEGLDQVPYMVNDSLFDLEEQPESIIIIGGGYIGLEIAQAYHRLGTDVSVLEMQGRILSTESKDITEELTEYLSAEGIGIVTGVSIINVKKEDGKVAAGYEIEGQQQIAEADHLVLATGRKANTEKLEPENAGIETAGKGHIKVNEKLETNIPGIYAIGDVNTFPQFVYSAAYEGEIAVDNAFQDSGRSVDYSSLPWVVFTDPQVAGVGMDEKEAGENNIPFETTVLPLTDVPRSITALDTRGFIKLIRNPESDLLLGARIVAPEGSELTMEAALAIRHNITVKEIVSALHPYLTLAEGLKLAAMSFTTDVKKMSCCAS
ncbi:MAG: mercury(II) reductase [Balneolaceae bacterium]